MGEVIKAYKGLNKDITYSEEDFVIWFSNAKRMRN